MASKRVRYEQARHGPELRDLTVELVRNCPLCCIHCSVSAAPGHPLQLSLDRLRGLIDEFVKLGGQNVTFTGGEPLTYHGLRSIVRYCRDQNLAVRLFTSGIVADTNGRRADTDSLASLAPYLDSAAFSVYAANPAVHDSITRVPGSFDLTLQAIDAAVMLRVSTKIHFVPTQWNHRELPGVVALAVRVGVEEVRILRFMPQGRGGSRAGELTLDRFAQAELRQQILELRGQHTDMILSVGAANNDLKVGEAKPCRAGLGKVAVAADGRVAPCEGLTSYCCEDEYDNVYWHPLRTVLERSRNLELARRALQTADRCVTCLVQELTEPACRDTLQMVQLEQPAT